MITSFIAGLGLGIIISLSVGPVIFMIIRYSISNGFQAGLAFVLGVSLSDIMYVTLGNLATSFFRELDEMAKIIGIFGGIVLIIIGFYGLFLKQVKLKSPENQEKRIKATRGHYFKIWLSGFLMNTLNPGVIILWLGICTANSTSSLRNRFILFTTALLFILSADITKVFLAHKIRDKLTLKAVMWLNRITSISMFVFGLLLIYAVLFEIDRFLP